MEIDKLLYSMIPLYEDRELLYSDVKKKFNWNDSQVKAAVDPILNRKLVELKQTKDKPKVKAKPKDKPKDKPKAKAKDKPKDKPKAKAKDKPKAAKPKKAKAAKKSNL